MSEMYKLSGFQQELDKAERFFSMHLTRQELKSRLNEIERLNNIIENTIKKCEYLLENNEIEINNKKYYKQKCDDIITNFIYEELKGSESNE